MGKANCSTKASGGSVVGTDVELFGQGTSSSMPRRFRQVLAKAWFPLIAVTLAGCGSSQKAASVAEMKRVQAAFGDLQIALDAGVSKQEFSQRLNDTLIKIGNLQNSEKLAENGLPKDKVAQVYIHFHRAAEAYKMSKEFFGDDLTASWEPDEVRAKFPELAESLGSHKILSRSAILQGLWKFAGERTRAASNLIDQL